MAKDTTSKPAFRHIRGTFHCSEISKHKNRAVVDFAVDVRRAFPMRGELRSPFARFGFPRLLSILSIKFRT